MGTERIHPDAPLLRALLDNGAFNDPLYLADVGCSGGIEEHWSSFAPQLRSVGFDPLVNEIERLRAGASDQQVYEAAFVGHHDHPWQTPDHAVENRDALKFAQPYERASCVRAQQLSELNYVAERYNHSTDIVFSERRIELDEYFAGSERDAVDFLKVDTDGCDFAVLSGADALLREGQVLGLSVEAQFHGNVHPQANVFSNIDRYLRECGYLLFDLAIYRYARAALPLRFVYDVPAQTHDGQAVWGEAIYFLDAGAPNFQELWDRPLGVKKLMKLACLLEHFGLPDCAAELLLTRRESFETVFNVDEALDVLASSVMGKPISYRAYDALFDYFMKRKAYAGFPHERPAPPQASAA